MGRATLARTIHEGPTAAAQQLDELPLADVLEVLVLDRQLIDTAYLARVAREYLGHVCDPNRVWVTPGRLTAMLRRFAPVSDWLVSPDRLRIGVMWLAWVIHDAHKR